jgi:saccharopine dehydrogenase (NAD+, L-lysine forming)
VTDRYHAGYTGAALGLKTWRWQLTNGNEPLPSVKTFTEGRGYYINKDELVAHIREDVVAGEKALGRKPTVMVMGALGRCGKGACDLFLQAGVPAENLTRWDLDETKNRHGPYEEIAQHDIFLNAVMLTLWGATFGQAITDKHARYTSLIPSRPLWTISCLPSRIAS